METQNLLASELEPYDIGIEINPEDYARLKEDIEKNGIRTPLHVHKKTVLAGNNRLKIALELGHQFVPCLLLPEMSFLEEKEYAIKDNLCRRHLTIPQKVELAAMLVEIEADKAKERQAEAGRQNITAYHAAEKLKNELTGNGENTPCELVVSELDTTNETSETRTLKKAAKEAGLSYDTAYKGTTLMQQSPEEWKKVKDREKSVNKAYRDFRREVPLGLKKGTNQEVVSQNIKELLVLVDVFDAGKTERIERLTRDTLTFDRLKELDDKHIDKLQARISDILQRLATIQSSLERLQNDCEEIQNDRNKE